MLLRTTTLYHGTCSSSLFGRYTSERTSPSANTSPSSLSSHTLYRSRFLPTTRLAVTFTSTESVTSQSTMLHLASTEFATCPFFNVLARTHDFSSHVVVHLSLGSHAGSNLQELAQCCCLNAVVCGEHVVLLVVLQLAIVPPIR